MSARVGSPASIADDPDAVTGKSHGDGTGGSVRTSHGDGFGAPATDAALRFSFQPEGWPKSLLPCGGAALEADPQMH